MKIRLWESQREYALCLAEMHAPVADVCNIFGASDPAMRASLAGQKASSGYRDLTGGKRRYPAMGQREYDDILMLAQRQLEQHPTLRAPYERLRKLLAVTYEELAPEEISVDRDSGLVGALDRIADAYQALGEQLVEAIAHVRMEQGVGIELHVRKVLDEQLGDMVAKHVEEFFS